MCWIKELIRCDCSVIHEDVVNQVKKKMLPDEKLYDLADLFKILGDPTRVRILWALKQSEMCVYDIAVVLDMTKSAVSHQLRVLKSARIVRARKEGKNVYYSFVDDHVKEIYALALEHGDEE